MTTHSLWQPAKVKKDMRGCELGICQLSFCHICNYKQEKITSQDILQVIFRKQQSR